MVENMDEKPQHQEDDSIDEIEQGVSEAKLDNKKNGINRSMVRYKSQSIIL